ncbi:hypothetical protein KIN20_030118 [Parelaphostrongylus tenuis]|uniref:Uncharacterized protein n=1 Tax=Parelaphostrongylus tenuis TaxID=148309 RepID=A0AAD5R3M9_PARTN|nr:hypothetical protein KIN20_030118 [Parelaphostrongylus tenuis]
MHHRLLIFVCFISVLLQVFKTVQSGVIAQGNIAEERSMEAGALMKDTSIQIDSEKSGKPAEQDNNDRSGKTADGSTEKRNDDNSCICSNGPRPCCRKSGKLGVFSGVFWATKLL